VSRAITREDLTSAVRLLARLPSRLRAPVTLVEARAVVRDRLDRRDELFLDLARRTIFERPASPYRPLLARAGCEWGDLARLVRADGVEGALRTLCRQGVYFTVDEFKGRRPVVRGSETFDVAPHRFHNPVATPELSIGTSGSRGRSTAVPLGLDQIRDNAIDLRLSLEARGGGRWTHALWSTPGSSALGSGVRLALMGTPPSRWFSQVDPRAAGLHPRYAWSARVVRLAGALARSPIPAPEYVPVQDPEPIARWMSAVLRAGGTPHLQTYVSGAVVVARAAERAGVPIRGAQFTVTGEPATPLRMAVVEAAGASVVPRYSMQETGTIGYGCLGRKASDEVHVYRHRHALVQPGEDGAALGLPAAALLATSLSPTARMILLNVSTGDQADLDERECGCPLQGLGWPTHLQNVRSFEKLTAAGMTFADADVVGVLEGVLPARFGGGPGDYQLQEVEDEAGRARLRLVVDPAVGALDEAAVSRAFLDVIGQGAGPERVMGQAWREWQVVQVVRARPATTGSGKILHLHVARELSTREPGAILGPTRPRRSTP
jgi:hypothetical protein